MAYKQTNQFSNVASITHNSRTNIYLLYHQLTSWDGMKNKLPVTTQHILGYCSFTAGLA